MSNDPKDAHCEECGKVAYYYCPVCKEYYCKECYNAGNHYFCGAEAKNQAQEDYIDRKRRMERENF